MMSVRLWPCCLTRVGERLSQSQPLDDDETGRAAAESESQNIGNEAKAMEIKEEPKLPDNYEAILFSDKDKHYDLLCAGVFFNQTKRRYWMEKQSNKHCVMVLARALHIDWGDDKTYWKWQQEPIEPNSDEKVEVVELLQVCWLEVHGKMDTRKLSQGTSYEVFLVIFMKNSADGWEFPVTLKLSQPNGKKEDYKDSFKEKERGKWIEIPVGEFTASPENAGEIEVCLLGYDGLKWKRGLIIKGVLIRSKN